MNINYQLIGKRISEARRDLGITQEELSVTADVSAQYISHIENGKKKVSLKVLAAICEGMDVSMDELVFGTARPPKAPEDEWTQLPLDLSLYEREVVFQTATAVKKILRMYETIR